MRLSPPRHTVVRGSSLRPPRPPLQIQVQVPAHAPSHPPDRPWTPRRARMTAIDCEVTFRHASIATCNARSCRGSRLTCISTQGSPPEPADPPCLLPGKIANKEPAQGRRDHGWRGWSCFSCAGNQPNASSSSRDFRRPPFPASVAALLPVLSAFFGSAPWSSSSLITLSSHLEHEGGQAFGMGERTCWKVLLLEGPFRT